MKNESLANNVIGNSDAMKQIRKTILMVANSPHSVLITGESGTGKELIARQIHYSSSRSANAFVAVNLGALPSNLAEIELLGYSKGAFTDAVKDKIGLIELAHRGTLFLDEIGEASNTVQIQLLNFIENKGIRRLGQNEVRSVDEWDANGDVGSNTT